jgi:hypothetical protein
MPPSGLAASELGKSQVAGRPKGGPVLHETTRPVLSDSAPVATVVPEPSLIVKAIPAGIPATNCVPLSIE